MSAVRAFPLTVLACLRLSAQQPAFVCSPDLPVATPGAAVHLYSFPAPAAISKPVYRWTVSSGSVQAAGGNVFNWKFDSTSLGVQTADGELRSGSTVVARCLVEVRVIDKLQASADSGLLLPGKAEPGGSGLYTYLLVTSSNDTALSAAKSWLSVSPSAAEFRRLVNPNESVSLTTPVLAAPGSAPTPEWLLRNYDFARARKLLERVAPAAKPGVYVVSSLKPIPESQPPYLIQDLNHVPSAVAGAWVHAFLNLALQNSSWNPEAESDLAGQMRAALLFIAKDTAGLGPSLLKWIALL